MRPTIAEGGRLVYARDPSWLIDYGEFPAHGKDGSPNYIWITGNMAGCADAGCIWETAYDKHLINVQKMTESVYDTRVFYKRTADGYFIIAHVHVDDTRLTASSMRDLDDFYTIWAHDLGEDRKPLVESNLDETFADIRHHFHDHTSCTLTCTSSIDQLELILNEFPLETFLSFNVPIAHDALQRLLAPPCATNPLVLEHLHNARRIIGLTSFVSSIRTEVSFPFKVLARFVNERRFTHYAWREIRRLAKYLVTTRDLGLTLIQTNGSLSAYVDSSLNNGPDGRSYGGFALQFSSPQAVSGSFLVS